MVMGFNISFMMTQGKRSHDLAVSHDLILSVYYTVLFIAMMTIPSILDQLMLTVIWWAIIRELVII